MERRTLPERLSWQLDEVVAMQPETARAKSITLALPNWRGHRAGQHVDVRLTAEDGYQAERSYSIASPPEEAPRVTRTELRRDAQWFPLRSASQSSRKTVQSVNYDIEFCNLHFVAGYLSPHLDQPAFFFQKLFFIISELIVEFVSVQ